MRYPAGSVLDRHSHDWAQLVYATQGVLRVETDEGFWVVPPQRAVWIPRRVAHSVAMSGPVSLRTLYLHPSIAETLPRRCRVVAVSPLLRELILHAIERGPLRADLACHRRLIDFLVDQLRLLPVVPLDLPLPRDPRALRVAERLRARPGEPVGLDVLARDAGASRRTLERLFRSETGISLGRWRKQARLLQAMRLLARGEPVTTIALEVGYESPSAFIATFASAFGTTPGRYYREQASRDRGRRSAPDMGIGGASDG